MRFESISLPLLLVALINASNFNENCKDTLYRGRLIIEKNVPLLVQEESIRRHRRLQTLENEKFTSEVVPHESFNWTNNMVQPDTQSVTTPPPCPSPNRTIFTTIAPTVFQSTTQSTEYMFKTEEICNQPPIKDLNSITEDQLYGFISTLAVIHPGPFCSLCDRFMSELRERIFVIHPLFTEDEQYITRLLYSHIPSSKAFCSTIAPGCYEDYEKRVRNFTEAVICLECSACMTIGKIIQHRFLLDKEMMKKVLQFLRSSLFHNTCAELCEVWQPLNLTLFPHGFTYEGCMNFFTNNFQTVVDIATVILRPERFCSLELQWCELNETPNMLHCLRELCVEFLHNTPQARWLCSLIPDTPSLADRFLNIHQTKRYKTRRSYHDEYRNKDDSWHEEL
ncbi:hypothetical protein DICVIV_01386 [Dictyocaulus viviparus]|uniref:Saposin B-type domain-containing protein n=1 Tax=Dictyocaulus viviparus TaxID=29172 RepID=A0A0D8Y8U8_DICVI|nr:hypothetical protein DICVIV_01386 [Dictyocaulus viviparus]